MDYFYNVRTSNSKLILNRLKTTYFSNDEIFIVSQLLLARSHRNGSRCKIYFGVDPGLFPGYEYFCYWLERPGTSTVEMNCATAVHLILLGVLEFEMSNKEYEVQCSLGISPRRYFVLSKKWCKYGLLKSSEHVHRRTNNVE